MMIGGDGVVWYFQDVRLGPPEIVAFDPSTGKTERFADSRIGSPDSLVEASDGSIWFTDVRASTVGTLDPSTGAVETISLPSPVNPQSIIAGDDHAVWFGTDVPGKIGRVGLDETAASLVDFGGPGVGEPHDLALGADGRIWIVEDLTDKIDAYDPRSGATDTYLMPDIGNRGIVAGPDGHLWLNGLLDVKRVSTAGSVDVFPLPRSTLTTIQAIDAGPRGVYVATKREIFAVGPDGSFRLIKPDPALFRLEDLDVAPDGYLWYQDALVGAPLMFG